MSKREWKPGAVAMVTASNQSEPWMAGFNGRTWVGLTEPTGLGAVVEDADGRRWVNSHRITAWVHQDLQPRKYDEINAVRVLSEGVDPS